MSQYSINKSRASLGHTGSEWEEKTVAELDSALNNFIDSVPDHRKRLFASLGLSFYSQTTASTLEPTSREHALPQSVVHLIRTVLFTPDDGTSTVHTKPSKPFEVFAAFSRDMHERRASVYPRTRCSIPTSTAGNTIGDRE